MSTTAPFGSALAVREFSLLSEIEVAPLGAVIGCDLESVDVALPEILPERTTPDGRYGTTLAGDVSPVRQLDELVDASRERALAHLRADAAALGADAVVGIRPLDTTAAHLTGSPDGPGRRITGSRSRSGRAQWLRRRLDVQLVGTAVRDPALAAPAPRLTTLSPADYRTLRLAGWEPAGLVAACAHRFGCRVNLAHFTGEVGSATSPWTDARAAAAAASRWESCSASGCSTPSGGSAPRGGSPR